MLKFLFRRLLPALASLSVVAPGAQAAVQNRIAAVESSQPVALAHSVSPKLSSAGVKDLGEADGTKALSTITLRFAMTASQKAALTQLLEDQQNPASASYHHWLTPEQFGAKFGMSSGDLLTVSQWLAGQGFTVTEVARSGTFIQASGTVAQAQTAFKTSIHRVSVNGEEHIANVTAVSLPSGIASVVGSVSGLDDFRLKPHLRTRQVPANTDPKFTSSVSGSNFIAPGDFYTIYDVNPLLTSSINGAGITIAVAGQTDVALSDVAAFRSAAGLSANLPTVTLYGKDPGTPLTNGVADDESEADLDLEWSGAVAPSASILYVNSTYVFNSLTQIIDKNLAPIASISYGGCEAAQGNATLSSFNALFQQANAQGITIVSAAGDAGATDCDDGTTTSATQGLAVDFPASSPNVTGLGGTMFNEGAGTYWQTASGSDVLSSALSYIPENVWNETADDITGSSPGFGAGGGGASVFFTKPSWQTGTGVPNDFARDVPDVALNAASNHDGYLYCTQGSCVNGFRTASGNLAVVGGTSVAAPSFAGILALVEQKTGSSIGNANPVIYALANSTYYNTVFHDVTVGDNTSPCTAGTTDCPSGGSIGYSANVGYDQATGWGSVDAYNLANLWTLVTPVGTGTGTQVSTTTLSASAASVASGTPVTITATVANGATSSLAAPTGTVQFLVDNVASGSAVTLVGSTATFALSTTALASGAHTVTASYSGDTVYAGSKGSVTVDVTSTTTADFTLSPATATVTVKSGADATGLVYTVTPLQGFTGSVAFTATTSSSSLNATYSFTVTPVTISSTAAGTTTLNLSAYVANAKTGAGLQRLKPMGTASITPTPSGIHRGWYAGSGAAFACVFLLMIPKRRRWNGLLAAVFALGVVSAMTGCGSSSSNTPTNTNATPGTYTIFVTATGTTSAGATVTHASTVTFVVQ